MIRITYKSILTTVNKEIHKNEHSHKMTRFWNRIAVWSSLHELALIYGSSHRSVFESPMYRVHNEHNFESLVTEFGSHERARNAVTHNRTHTYKHKYTLHWHVHADTYVYKYTHTYTLHLYTYTYIHVYTSIYIYTYKYVKIYTHTYPNTHIITKYTQHTQTHACILINSHTFKWHTPTFTVTHKYYINTHSNIYPHKNLHTQHATCT